MDAEKTGRLIRRLREEKGMTQVQLGERLHISNKTVSKWETGGGATDISLLPALGEVLGVEVKALLEGDMGEQPEANGNLRKMCFYVCPRCKRLLLSEGRGDINCCGQKLESFPCKNRMLPISLPYLPGTETGCWKALILWSGLIISLLWPFLPRTL